MPPRGRPNSKLSLTIAHKGMIMVSVPLVLGLIFVAILWYLLKQAELEARKAARSRAVVSETADLERDVFMSGDLKFLYRATSNKLFLQKYDERVAAVPVHCQVLEELTRAKPAEADMAREICDLSNQIVELTKTFGREADSPLGKLMDIRSYRNEMQFKVEHLERAVAEIHDLERHSESAAQTQAHAKEYVQYMLIAGIIVDVLMTAIMLRFFSKEITARLGILKENAINLARRRPLHGPVSGQDEIANLDAVFHEMADELLMAQQRKQEFVSMISHDLRSPLSSLNANLDLVEKGLQSDEADPERQMFRVGSARRSVGAMMRLVNGLLDVDKMDAGMLVLSLENKPISELVDGAINSVQFSAVQKSITIDSDIQPIVAEVDADRVEQVIINLLSNAIKYSPKGSEVLIQACDDSGWLKVEVTDHGRGISQQQVGSLFKRFVLLDQKDAAHHQGIGLGLTICKALVEAHHGTIGVESKESEGSKFWFRIPCKASGNAATKERE